MATRTGDFLIADPRQMEELASAVRQDIVDAVVGLGQCTMRELAEALGRPVDGLYYHVRRLVAAGLLAESRPADGEGEVIVRSLTRGVMRLVYEPPSPRRHDVLRRIVGSLLRSAERDFTDALGSARARTSGRRRNLNASRQRAWLTPTELEEVNVLLQRIQAICARPRDAEGAALHSFTFVMAPLEARPARRGDDAPPPRRRGRGGAPLGARVVGALAALLAGCGSPSSPPPDGYAVHADAPAADTVRWRIDGEAPPARVFVPTADLQITSLDTAGAEPIGRIGHLAGRADGGTILHDAGAHRIVWYDATGRPARQVGRAGSGPGEYGLVFGMALVPGDDLVVWDGSGSRLLWFAPDGSYRTQRVIPATGRSGTDGLHADSVGSLYLRASLPAPGGDDAPRVPGVVRLDATGPQDTLRFPSRVEPSPPLRARLPNGAVIYGGTVPFLPRDHHGVTGAGVLVSAPSSEQAIHFAASGGRPARTVAHPRPRLPVPESERDSIRARLEAEMREVDPGWTWTGPEIPDVRPTHEGLFVDRVGRLWLRRATPAGPGVPPAHARYDVHASDGAPIAEVRLPPRARLAAATATHLWWVQRDSLDVPIIERASLDLPTPIPLPPPR